MLLWKYPLTGMLRICLSGKGTGKRMGKENFRIVEKTESVNLEEYRKRFPTRFFWARLDKEHPGYGWIVARDTTGRIVESHHEIDNIIDECKLFRPLVRRKPMTLKLINK